MSVHEPSMIISLNMTKQDKKLICLCGECRPKSLILCVWQRSTKIRMKCEISSGTGLFLVLQATKWLFEV